MTVALFPPGRFTGNMSSSVLSPSPGLDEVIPASAARVQERKDGEPMSSGSDSSLSLFTVVPWLVLLGFSIHAARKTRWWSAGLMILACRSTLADTQSSSLG